VGEVRTGTSTAPSHVYILSRRGEMKLVSEEKVFFMIPMDWGRQILFCS
jgi:hypothetical protein